MMKMTGVYYTPVGEFPCFIIDLAGQFTGWSQYQGNRVLLTTAVGPIGFHHIVITGTALIDLVKHWNEEGSSLP